MASAFEGIQGMVFFSSSLFASWGWGDRGGQDFLQNIHSFQKECVDAYGLLGFHLETDDIV